MRQIVFKTSVEFAFVLVIERRPGLFFPLFRWYGSSMPPTIHAAGNRNILAVAKDFGGNVPMVTTWAWIWTASGPLRLQLEKAVHAGIQKVAPGHGGYNTELDWKTLCAGTFTWGPEGYPGKVGVHEGAKVCLTLRGDRLEIKSAEWSDFADPSKVKRWP